MNELSLQLDGDQWCALWGVNLMEGTAGFGNTPAEAIIALGKEVEKSREITHTQETQTS